MESNDRKTEREKLENKAFQEIKNEGRLKEEAREIKENGSRNRNNLWIWLGVLVLVFIIIYWLFAIGTFGDLANWFNG